MLRDSSPPSVMTQSAPALPSEKELREYTFPAVVWPVAAALAGMVLLAAPAASPLIVGACWMLLFLLPGIAVCRVLDREADALELVVLGAALSPAVITASVYLTAYLLRLPLSISHLVTGVFLAGLLLYTSLNREPVVVPTSNLPAGLVFGLAFFLVVLVAALFISRPIFTAEPHGLFHTAITHQVMNGIIPPHNLHLYDAPTAYQWPCYIFPAAASSLTGAAPPIIAALLRIHMFAVIFGLGYLMARTLGLGTPGRALSGLFSALGMNMAGGLHYLAVMLSTPALRNAFLGGEYTSRLLLIFTPGFVPLYLKTRLSTLIIKLVHFSFVLPGYVMVMIALLGVILVLGGKGRKGYPLLFLGTLGALLIHPVLGAILALPLPLALAGLWVVRQWGGGDLPLKRVLLLVATLAVPALLALPYLIPEMDTSGSYAVATEVSRSMMVGLLWVYAPLGILAAITICRGPRRLGQARTLLFLLVLLSAVFITVQRLKCEWYMLYVTAVPLGLLAADALGSWLERTRCHWLRVTVLSLIMLLAVSGPLLRLHSYGFSRFATENRYLFGGEAMIRLQEDTSDLAHAYGWIRENTPLNSVLVEQPRKHSREELAALTGRRVYVGQPSVHTPPADDPRMAAALAAVRTLFNPEENDKQRVFSSLAALPDPVYIFQNQDPLDSARSTTADLSGYPQWLSLCFHTPRMKIYRVIPSD